MSPSKSEITKKVASTTFKLLSTALLWTGTALLTKLRLAPTAQTWRSALDQLPVWALVILIIVMPLAWLVVEFITACFLEVRARVLEQAAPRFAIWLTEVPGVVTEVIGRSWDTILICMSRWRFDGRYRQRIAEECKQLHAQTGLLHETADFSLEEAYTELSMAPARYGEIAHGLLANNIRGRESVYEFLRLQEPGTALALLGRPGGGKTTLLRHLGLLFANNRQGKHRLRRRIPIMIELRRVTALFASKPGADWKMPTLAQVIHHYWKSHAGMKDLMAKAPTEWLKRHLASGRVIIMVDGLDEVPHRLGAFNVSELTPRQRVSQWLETEMQREDQRRCLFLVTARPGGFAEAPLRQRVSILEVQSLTMAQSERFIYAFYLGRKRKDLPSAKKTVIQFEAAQATERLQKELRRKPHLADLRVNPLLLHMVCLLHNSRGRLPTHRSDLYKETCEVLVNRDLRAPGFEERLRPEDKLAALRPLADYFMRSESPEAKATAELLPVIQPVFETLDFPARDFFDFAAKDTGLLQEVEKGYWDFAHKTFYEFLAAEHWEHNPPNKDELLNWVAQDWWRVTLFFHSAKSHDSPVISAGLRSGQTSALSLAFECINAKHRINAAERRRAQELINIALAKPSDELTFSTAARAVLDLKMREVQACDPEGKILRRESLVTNAEYQLFLLSHGSNTIWDYIPPHWTNRYASGDPLAPVQGVTFEQASAFARWASEVSSHEWSLPLREIDDSEGPYGWWRRVVPNDNDDTLVGDNAVISDQRCILQKELSLFLDSVDIFFTADLNLASVMAPSGFASVKLRKRAGRISFIRRVYHRVFGVPLNALLAPIGLAVFYTLECCKWASITHVDRLADRVEGVRKFCIRGLKDMSVYQMPFYYSLGRAFDCAYNSIADFPLEKETYRMLVDAVVTHRTSLDDHFFAATKAIYNAFADVAVKAGLLKSEETGPRRVLLLGPQIRSRVPREDQACWLNRIDLLVALAETFPASNVPSLDRTFVNYGLCLLRALTPHLGQTERELVRPTLVLLNLQQARLDGRLPPWESILLVRPG